MIYGTQEAQYKVLVDTSNTRAIKCAYYRKVLNYNNIKFIKSC